MVKITYIGCESSARGEVVKFDVGDKRYEYDVGFYFMERISDLALRSPEMAFDLAKQAGTRVKPETESTEE